MAVYNEILAGRYNRALQKMMGIKGPPPTPQLSSEIMPVIQMFYGAEHRYLEGWYRFGPALAIAASAANVNAIRIRNPVGSGVVAVFEKIFLLNTAAAVQTYQLSNGAITSDLGGAVILTNARFDPRGNPTTTLIGSSVQAGSITALGSTFLNVALGVNAQMDAIVTDIQEIPLLPGDGLQFQTQVVNQSLQVAFWWRERPLEDSEKQ